MTHNTRLKSKKWCNLGKTEILIYQRIFLESYKLDKKSPKKCIMTEMVNPGFFPDKTSHIT